MTETLAEDAGDVRRQGRPGGRAASARQRLAPQRDVAAGRFAEAEGATQGEAPGSFGLAAQSRGQSDQSFAGLLVMRLPGDLKQVVMQLEPFYKPVHGAPET